MDSRRSQQTSDESSSSCISSAFGADIELTNRLSALLDARHNEEVERQLQLVKGAPSQEVLCRVLSINSVVSTSSSFATFNQENHNVSAGFRTIGFGQCGIVFERPGRGYVIKVARPFFEESLWSDLQAHFAVHHAFQEQQQQQRQLEVKTPRVFSFIPKDYREWWDSHLPLFDIQGQFSVPSMALITERILPIPKVARQALIDTYCPASYRVAVSSHSTNRDCLARIYLGRRRPAEHPPPANFTLRNFNLCLDQMIELNLPVYHYAKAIGEALATIHWAANVDGYDVEFVLGSEGDTRYTQDISSSLGLTPQAIAEMPKYTNLDAMMSVNFKRRTTGIWVLDFNLCNMWQESTGYEKPDELISQLVLAFFENDPYYPRPTDLQGVDHDLWVAFSSEYLKRATEILAVKDLRLADLPQRFIRACVVRQENDARIN